MTDRGSNEMRNINITDAEVNIFLNINGNIHAVAMEKDALEAINFLIKRAVVNVIETRKTQTELLEFLNLNSYRG